MAGINRLHFLLRQVEMEGYLRKMLSAFLRGPTEIPVNF